MSLTLERACSLPAVTALPRLAAHFAKGGYESVAKSASELSLFYRAGALPHRLSVRSDGRNLFFTFAPVAAGAADGFEAAKGELERRADEAVAQLKGLPTSSGAASARCPTCSSMNEPHARTCAVCGTAL